MTDESLGPPKSFPPRLDRKEFRITVRIAESELETLREESRRRYLTVGATLRVLIREMGRDKDRHRSR
jgi:translation initiation factor IF-3